MSHLSPVETPGLGLDFLLCILSEVFAPTETSCCALPLNEDVHSRDKPNQTDQPPAPQNQPTNQKPNKQQNQNKTR